MAAPRDDRGSNREPLCALVQTGRYTARGSRLGVDSPNTWPREPPPGCPEEPPGRSGGGARRGPLERRCERTDDDVVPESRGGWHDDRAFPTARVAWKDVDRAGDLVSLASVMPRPA